MSKVKPFSISKQAVVEAFKRVKANKGVAGVDDQSIADFEKDLKNNLYKVWNRMSSGSYFPPPVRKEEIPKADGSKRPLGIPRVGDRRDKGTPQGSVISPLLANLFLHYAFDSWMHRNSPTVPFERYADDIVVHCRSEKQTQWIRDIIGKRMAECKLELHPEKTKIVFCKNANRRGKYPYEKFDFLGYEFRPRLARSRYGKNFVNFSPAIRPKSTKTIRDTIRSWKIQYL